MRLVLARPTEQGSYTLKRNSTSLRGRIVSARERDAAGSGAFTAIERMGTVGSAFIPRTVCELPSHGEIPLASAASNSVRATCSAFSVAAAPTGFAS